MVKTSSNSTAGGNLKARAATAAGTFLLSAMSENLLSHSEDCLTLNIWTKPQSGESRKAVLFWIHGGAFVSGRFQECELQLESSNLTANRKLGSAVV